MTYSVQPSARLASTQDGRVKFYTGNRWGTECITKTKRITEATRLQLQQPKSLMDTAALLAKEGCVSLNLWIVSAIAQKFGAVLTAEDFLKAHSGVSKPGDLTKLLDRVPKAPPAPVDAFPD